MGEVVASASPAAIPVFERFTGVHLYDGTVVALPDEMREVYPGCGGGRGREAAMKIGARLELSRGGLCAALGAGRSHDRTLAQGAEEMPEGALRLADLGFFDLALLGSLSAAGRHWLTRLMAGTAVYDAESGERLELAPLLGACGGGEVELGVEVGARARLPARLLAHRVPEEVANERRRGLRAGARRRRQPVSAERMSLAVWAILITDAPKELLAIGEALAVTRARRQIEKLFDLWERHGHLDKSRSRKPRRILTEVYAKLIGLIVGHWAILADSWRRADRSLVKATRAVRRMAFSMAGDLGDLRRLGRSLESIARCLEAGRRVEKRRKQPGAAQQLLALTEAGKEVAVA